LAAGRHGGVHHLLHHGLAHALQHRVVEPGRDPARADAVGTDPLARVSAASWRVSWITAPLEAL
jgi:hypothetical protein